MNSLRVEQLKVYFKQHRKLVKALDGVDIFLKPGITTALAGESGCGKTTLARTILGFHRFHQGRIYFNNREISAIKNERLIRKNIQIVFQNPYLSLDPRYTVFAALYEALSVVQKVTKSQGEKIIAETLKEVELETDILSRYPHQLSGGQRQRVCIARSIINRPRLVILDEPTSSLDVTTAAKIIQLLLRLQKELGITYLFISHNLKLLAKISQKCFIMYQGKIMEYGPTEAVYNRPRHPYTQLLREAAQYQLKSLPDTSFVPLSGCPFLPRCLYKKDICVQECRKIQVGPEHFVYCHRQGC